MPEIKLKNRESNKQPESNDVIRFITDLESQEFAKPILHYGRIMRQSPTEVQINPLKSETELYINLRRESKCNNIAERHQSAIKIDPSLSDICSTGNPGNGAGHVENPVLDSYAFLYNKLRRPTMSKLYLILSMLFLCNNVFAGQPIKKDCYEQGYHDGSIYALVQQYELDIDTDYEMLMKLEGQGGKEISQLMDHFVKTLNAKLHTLGLIIEDIDSKNILSPYFYEFQKKQDETFRKNLEKKIGKDKLKMMDSIDGKAFWKKLKKMRTQKNWKMEIKNEKFRNEFEKYIDLALDTYIRYGNAFKIE